MFSQPDPLKVTGLWGSPYDFNYSLVAKFPFQFFGFGLGLDFGLRLGLGLVIYYLDYV